MAAGRRMLDQQEVPWMAMAGLRLRDNNSILTLSEFEAWLLQVRVRREKRDV